MLLEGDAFSSDAALAGPSLEEAPVGVPEAANIDQADRSAMDALDAIQLHDAEAERQLQELLESSRVAEQESGAALEDEVEEGLQARQLGSSPISPAGSRAMLKSQLWEQQVRLPKSPPFSAHTHTPKGHVDQSQCLPQSQLHLCCRLDCSRNRSASACRMSIPFYKLEMFACCSNSS